MTALFVMLNSYLVYDAYDMVLSSGIQLVPCNAYDIVLVRLPMVILSAAVILLVATSLSASFTFSMAA